MEVYQDGVEVLTVWNDKCEYCEEKIEDIEDCPLDYPWCDPGCYYYKEILGDTPDGEEDE